MNGRFLVTGLLLSCAVSATAQLSGTFYLDKTTFAPGEPIFLHFKVSNPGHEEGMINTTGLPGRPSCAGYFIEISRDSSTASSCEKLMFSNPLDGCAYDGPLSAQTIEPGKSVTQRILLNIDSDLNTPGEYSIHAKYFNFMGGAESKLDTETKLHLQVDRSAPAPTRGSFQPWVDRLHSRNEWKRAEAVEVLANVAPRSLENVLLEFAHDPNLRWAAPLALHRLNTPRSIAALAALLQGPVPRDLQEDNNAYAASTGNPKWPLLLQDAAKAEAARYLAETGDQKWVPVLFNTAERYPPITLILRPQQNSAVIKQFRHLSVSRTDRIENSQLKMQLRRWAPQALGVRYLTYLSISGVQSPKSPKAQMLACSRLLAALQQ